MEREQETVGNRHSEDKSSEQARIHDTALRRSQGDFPEVGAGATQQSEVTKDRRAMTATDARVHTKTEKLFNEHVLGNPEPNIEPEATDQGEELALGAAGLGAAVQTGSALLEAGAEEVGKEPEEPTFSSRPTAREKYGSDGDAAPDTPGKGVLSWASGEHVSPDLTPELAEMSSVSGPAARQSAMPMPQSQPTFGHVSSPALAVESHTGKAMSSKDIFGS